jgi:hypothetical protein
MSTRTLWNLVSLKKKGNFLINGILFSCEILSPCGSSPCVRGTCQNRNSTLFQCTCQPGFTGKVFILFN